VVYLLQTIIYVCTGDPDIRTTTYRNSIILTVDILSYIDEIPKPNIKLFFLNILNTVLYSHLVLIETKMQLLYYILNKKIV